MTSYVRGLLFGVGVVLAAALVATVSAADEDEKEIKEARKDILDLAKIVEDDKGAKAVDAKVAAIKKKYEDLNTLMFIYKPKEGLKGKPGGLGFGDNPKWGIELEIRGLAKRKLSSLTLKKNSRELIRMGYLNIAMADISKHYFTKPKGPKNKKDWDKHLDDQKKAAKALIEAVKAKDAAKIKIAANDLDAACANCHGDFRDNN